MRTLALALTALTLLAAPARAETWRVLRSGPVSAEVAEGEPMPQPNGRVRLRALELYASFEFFKVDYDRSLLEFDCAGRTSRTVESVSYRRGGVALPKVDLSDYGVDPTKPQPFEPDSTDAVLAGYACGWDKQDPLPQVLTADDMLDVYRAVVADQARAAGGSAGPAAAASAAPAAPGARTRRLIGEGGHIQVFADSTPTKRPDGHVRLWTLTVLAATDEDGADYWKSLKEYDCAVRASRTITIVAYALSGKTAYSLSEPGEWNDLVPDSLGDAAGRYACGTEPAGAEVYETDDSIETLVESFREYKAETATAPAKAAGGR
jgi:hypothetical protein